MNIFPAAPLAAKKEAALIATLALALAAASAGNPPAAALEMGREIARSGTLATLAPLKTMSDIDALIAESSELTPEHQNLLRRIGEVQAAALLARVIDVEGRAFAANLSVNDMQSIIAFERSPAAERKRAAMAPVIIATFKEFDGFDYLGEVKAEFCQQTGKLCPQPGE